MSKLCCIYMIINTDSNMCYVGQTQHFEERVRSHRQALLRGNHFNIKLQRAFNKSQSQFIMVPLEICEPHLLNSREIFWINLLQCTNRKKGYNLQSGGQNGKMFSEDCIKRRSIARRGKSTTLKGRPQSKQWIEARAKANRGQKRNYSKEHITSISNAMKARKGTTHKGIGIEIIVGNKSIEFQSIRKAAEYLGIDEKKFNNKFYKGRAKTLVNKIEFNNMQILRKDGI